MPLLAAVVLLACARLPASAATPEAPPDDVLRAMQAELQRSTGSLKLPDYEAPYFVAYRVEDLRQHRIAGAQGALHEDDTQEARTAWVDVRVGDWSLDSSEDDSVEWPWEQGWTPGTRLPLADAPHAIRHALWLLTDQAYKQAVSSYLKVKGKRVFEPDEERKRPSHSRAPAARHLEPRRDLTVDAQRWRAVVRRLGTLVGDHEHVLDSSVVFQARVETRWIVTSEGIRLRTVEPMYEIHVAAWTRADDGMLLDLSLDRYGRSEEALPDDEALVARTEAMLGDLVALREAPVLEPYTGPAILEPRATGVFFHEVLGHRLEAHRLEGEEQGQTFAEHLGREILPPSLSVFDDPTLEHVGRVSLNGAYHFDDEGVRAQAVTLVDRGTLRGFLMGRRPVEGFEASNGHGRAETGLDPVARMANLRVVTHQPVSRERLDALLLELVREQGKPYGLVVRDLAGGSTNTSSYGYQAFKGEARVVYKVDAETGERTLVRGVDLVGTPLTSLGKIAAASDQEGVFNGYCGAESGVVPVSTVAPATLFREIELQRSARERSRGPILRPPARNP
ncbi:MAG: TldD/PmbA family protein [Myxococcota bacterium]